MRRNRFRLIPSKMEGLLIQKSSDFKGLSILIFDGVLLLRESMLESWGIHRDRFLLEDNLLFCAFVIFYTDYSDLFSMDYPKKFS